MGRHGSKNFGEGNLSRHHGEQPVRFQGLGGKLGESFVDRISHTFIGRVGDDRVEVTLGNKKFLIAAYTDCCPSGSSVAEPISQGLDVLFRTKPLLLSNRLLPRKPKSPSLSFSELVFAQEVLSDPLHELSQR